MTFTPQVRVRGHDDALLKNHPVFLVTYGINGTTKQTLTTDNNGLASFTLDTGTWNATAVSLEVSPEEAASQMRRTPWREGSRLLSAVLWLMWRQLCHSLAPQEVSLGSFGF